MQETPTVQQPTPPQQPPFNRPPTYQPPQKPPRSRKRLWLILGIIAAVLVLVVISASMASSGGQQTATQSTTQPVPTQAPTEASQPPPTQVIPTPIPTIAPISLSGVGQQASHKFQLQQGLSIFKMTHNGTSNFAVVLYDSNGQYIDLLANQIGKFDGSKAESIPSDGIYLFDVQADGNWTITIQ